MKPVEHQIYIAGENGGNPDMGSRPFGALRVRSWLVCPPSLFAYLCAFLWPFSCAAFSFDDIEFWVGAGANRAALVIDWKEGDTEPPALAWGYRWDGEATGRDMLVAIVTADPRLYAKVGGSAASPVSINGLGYDANDDDLFSIDDGTQFDANGFAIGGTDDFAASNDPGDYYAEGWFAGFWHYGIETPNGTNPYDGGGWFDIQRGMASRNLVDGSWDSWAFETTTLPPFDAYAENPVAAPPPFSPGDFNHDGEVDTMDYDVWRTAFGSTTETSADANGDGVVDAADYVIWRKHITPRSTGSRIASGANVPEPATATASLIALLCFITTVRRKPLMVANGRTLWADWFVSEYLRR